MKAELTNPSLPWNLVCVNFQADQSINVEVQSELAGLETDLTQLPLRLEHLNVTITQSKAAEDYFLSLTLRLPHTILEVDESATDIREGMRAACTELRKALWSESAEDSDALLPNVSMTFGDPLATGAGPQSRGEMVKELFASSYDQLIRYARRRLQFYESSGLLPEGMVDPRDLVDEAALHCLESPRDELPRLNYSVWFHGLVREELRRCCQHIRELSERKGEFPVVSLEEKHSEDLDDLGAQAVEPDERLAEDRVTDPKIRTPEEIAEESDLVRLVLDHASDWPPLEREVFILHYLEGFGAEEIARLEEATTEEIDRALEQITQRLRTMFGDEPYLRS